MVSFTGSRARVSIVSAMLIFASILCARAQVVDFQKERTPIVEIHDLWRFHTGDDPDGKLGWANPDFDDSKWQLLRSDQPINVQGYPSYGGMSWYRFRILIPANHSPLALYMPGLGTSYQVFVGGQMIGKFGGLPPHERAYVNSFGAPQEPPLGVIVPIPPRVDNGTSSLVVAIRVWDWTDWALFNDAKGFQGVRIGDVNLISEKRQDRWEHMSWSLSAENFLFLAYLLAAIVGLGLFLLRPGEREYLWFAANYLIGAAGTFWNLYPVFHPVWEQGYIAVTGLLAFLTGICTPIFYVTLLKQPRGWPFWNSIGTAIFGTLLFIPVVLEWISLQVWFPLIFLAWIPSMAFQFPIIYTPARRGNLDARLLLVPFCLGFGSFVGGGLLLGLSASALGGPALASLADKWQLLFHWPFPISVPEIINFVGDISLLAILVLRFARTRRDEERFKGELEAARTVQQVLIPEEIPTIPGFGLECIYRPAGQVGGDFFQILPTRAGGALIVIGDVSGKGMPAAMAVSLLVGTVRTLAHYTQSPAEILAAMNQRMHGRSKDGFTTCLILHIDRDGSATIANAGHLAPYEGAHEISVGHGLPLGIDAESVYTESTFRFDVGQELTLLTDGIAEARSKSGELFGFERTASISILSAEHIAATAAAFGQQDDITVLKIRRRPVPELVSATASASTLSLN